MRQRIITLFLILCCTLAGCSKVIKPYRPPIQQGNILKADMLDKLHLGMTKNQVVTVLGNPILTDPFDEDVWTYVYTYQPSRGKFKENKIVLQFANNRLIDINTDMKQPLPKPGIKGNGS